MDKKKIIDSLNSRLIDSPFKFTESDIHEGLPKFDCACYAITDTDGILFGRWWHDAFYKTVVQENGYVTSEAVDKEKIVAYIVYAG